MSKNTNPAADLTETECLAVACPRCGSIAGLACKFTQAVPGVTLASQVGADKSPCTKRRVAALAAYESVA